MSGPRSPLVRRFALLAVGLATAAGLTFLWVVSRSAPGEADEPDALQPGVQTDAASHDTPAPASSLTGGSSVERSVRAEAGPEVGVWIRGLVRLPQGAPTDDTLEVVAFSYESKATVAERNHSATGEIDMLLRTAPELVYARARIEPDASGTAGFELGLPDGLPETVRVAVRGRFLFQAEAQIASTTAAEELELSPQLGAELALIGVVPEGEDPSTLANARVTVHGIAKGGSYEPSSMSTREAALGPDGTLHVGGLPAGLEYWVIARPSLYTDRTQRDLTLTAGETHELELAFESAGRVDGLVQDASQQPVSGAQVLAYVRNDKRRPIGSGETLTDAGGRFSIGGLPAGTLQLTARHERFVDSRTELSLGDDEHVTDVVITLASGDGLAGRVEWPDGTPAVGAEVRATGGRTDKSRSSTTDEDGAFAISGLENGPYYVRAGAYGEGRAPWSAQVEDVAGGTRALRLVLRAPPGIRGRVVDDLDRPITSFVLEGHLVNAQERAVGGSDGSLRQSFQTDDGTFVLSNATPGQWRIEALAEGYMRIEEPTYTRVHAADEGESQPTTLVLHRAATIAGQVVDPGGSPVADAKVNAGVTEPGFFEGLTETRSIETDAQGTFRLSVPPGATTVLASKDGLAPSEPLALMLEPSIEHENLTLRLRIGGRLTGEVSEDGEPSRGRDVMLLSDQLGMGPRSETDELGHFTIEHIAPGTYNLVVDDDGGEIPRFETVEIVDGETTHVVIGEPEREIRVHGRITRSGEPFHRSGLIVLKEGSSLFDSLAQCRVEEDGSYEVMLESPGPYTYFFERIGYEHAVTIPDADEARIDVQLPAGRISGVVSDADGPLRKARVELYREDTSSFLAHVDGGGPGERTDAEGNYRFDGLAPGRYSIVASGANDDDAGRQVRSGIVLGLDAEVTGVDFLLEAPSRLQGRVTTEDGHPVPMAAVFLRDASGVPLHAFARHTTDRLGRFEVEDLTPGEVSILVRTGDGLAVEASARTSSEETTEVELVAKTATLLQVTLKDETGEVRGAELSVRDESGREHGNLTSPWDIERFVKQGYSTSSRTVGPLPPGRYVVEGTDATGRRARREVELDGEAQQSLELLFE